MTVDGESEAEVVRHLTDQALYAHVADLEFRASIGVAEIRRRDAKRKLEEGDE